VFDSGKLICAIGHTCRQVASSAPRFSRSFLYYDSDDSISFVKFVNDARDFTECRLNYLRCHQLSRRERELSVKRLSLPKIRDICQNVKRPLCGTLLRSGCESVLFVSLLSEMFQRGLCRFPLNSGIRNLKYRLHPSTRNVDDNKITMLANVYRYSKTMQSRCSKNIGVTCRTIKYMFSIAIYRIGNRHDNDTSIR